MWERLDVLLDEDTKLLPVGLGVGHQSALQLLVHGEPEHIDRQADRRHAELACFEALEVMNAAVEPLADFLEENLLRPIQYLRQRLPLVPLQLLGADRHVGSELEKQRQPFLIARQADVGQPRITVMRVNFARWRHADLSSWILRHPDGRLGHAETDSKRKHKQPENDERHAHMLHPTKNFTGHLALHSLCRRQLYRCP